jgi:transposase
MKPLSLDLRRRVLTALQKEPSSLIVARRFDVSGSFVRKLRARVLETGRIEASPLPGKERLVKGEVERTLREMVKEFPDATLNVLREMLEDATSVRVSETTMWRQLIRMGFTRKKNSGAQRAKPSRRRARP